MRGLNRTWAISCRSTVQIYQGDLESLQMEPLRILQLCCQVIPVYTINIFRELMFQVHVLGQAENSSSRCKKLISVSLDIVHPAGCCAAEVKIKWIERKPVGKSQCKNDRTTVYLFTRHVWNTGAPNVDINFCSFDLVEILLLEVRGKRTRQHSWTQHWGPSACPLPTCGKRRKNFSWLSPAKEGSNVGWARDSMKRKLEGPQSFQVTEVQQDDGAQLKGIKRSEKIHTRQ